MNRVDKVDRKVWRTPSAAAFPFLLTPFLSSSSPTLPLLSALCVHWFILFWSVEMMCNFAASYFN